MGKFTKRNFIKVLSGVFILFCASYVTGFSNMKNILNKINKRLFGSGAESVPADSQRDDWQFLDGYENVSVEKALNSRCTGDFDGDQNSFHWGLFNKTKKISEKQVSEIISRVNIPRFTHKNLKMQKVKNIISFVVEANVTGIENEWLMVESGMQQQCVSLICAAAGVGLAFRNMGKDGEQLSETDFRTIGMQLEPMMPSYGGSYWTAAALDEAQKSGNYNIPDVTRDGSTTLFSGIKGITTVYNGRNSTDEKVLSQLLWAAKGRTPHSYLSKKWGMTIPTWQGEQHVTSVHLISDSKCYEYLNWNNNTAAHLINPLQIQHNEFFSNYKDSFPFGKHSIVISANDTHTHALWQVGFILLNILLQSKALDVSFKAELLNVKQRTIFNKVNIEKPVAIVSFI